jgi:hypothetical protein
LACTGCRATEALSIRIKDLDLESIPAKVMIRGEYTKTKVDRYVFLTNEIVEQLETWLNFKYRTRRVCGRDKQTGKLIAEYRTPEKNHDDLVFSIRNNNTSSINGHKKNLNRSPGSKPQNNYHYIVTLFNKTLDRIGMGSREDGNEIRRKISFHSMRRYVKSTISDLGYADYSEWFIGHSGSEYWKRKDSEKAEIFKKIEPYLTFLNLPQLERQGADLQTKVEELQLINQSLRENDKVKEDALAHLSDQLLILSERIQQLERKQII